MTGVRNTLASIPGGAALCFSSDPAVSSSIFVGAEGEETLNRNDPGKSKFTFKSCSKIGDLCLNVVVCARCPIDRFPNYCLGARQGKDLVAKGCYGPWSILLNVSLPRFPVWHLV